MPSLPDIRQSESFDCGSAAVKCVLLYWWERLPKGTSIPCTPLDGTHPATITAVFRMAGLKVLSGEASIEVMAALVKQGVPIVTLVQSEGEGHYVVVSNVARGRVYFQDPYDGPRSMKVCDFINNWADADVFGTKYSQFIIGAYP